LSKTYSNGVEALRGVTLTIPQGMYGLLGPNGAGKSALMRILATLQEPDQGSIHLGDTDVLNRKDEVRKTLGYLPQEFGVYPKVSAEDLLDHFALLALVVHVLVGQKYIGHLVAIIAYVFIALASMFGIEHNLLIYGAGPGWSYTEMRGFGPFLGPWLWFKLCWAAWALLLAVVARLLWERGRERGLGVRLQLARRRFTRPTAWTAAAAVGLILTLGGFSFYNTNVLNEYLTASDTTGLRAEYERRYGRYEDLPPPG
ncbi:MAG: ATP-binding cassette domain-containing protein, partial [Chloroflexota bacterium]